MCESPITCVHCQTEFSQEFCIRKDGRKCYVIKTWRELGGDAGFMSTNWTNQCHMGRYEPQDFQEFDEPLQDSATGGSIRRPMMKHEASMIQCERKFQFKVLQKALSILATDDRLWTSGNAGSQFTRGLSTGEIPTILRHEAWRKESLESPSKAIPGRSRPLWDIETLKGRPHDHRRIQTQLIGPKPREGMIIRTGSPLKST